MDLQRDQINEAKQGNFILFGSRREIRRLPLYLHKGEEVIKIITGSPGRNRGRGIIVITDERLLFIKDGWVFRTAQDFPYETISSVEFRTGIFFGAIILYAKGDETAYNWIGRFAGASFSQIARELSSNAKRHPGGQRPGKPLETAPVTATEVVEPVDSITRALTELQELKIQGLINENDYEIKRQEILLRL